MRMDHGQGAFAHLELPFFEERHRAFARALDAWAGANVGHAHPSERAAGVVDRGALARMRVAGVLAGPRVERPRERAVAIFEERQLEMRERALAVVHGRHQRGATRSPGSTSYGSPQPGIVRSRSRHVAILGKRSSRTMPLSSAG